MMTISERLRKIRETKKLTQQQLAQIMGVMLPRVRNIENRNANSLNQKEMINLKNRLNISIDWLMTGDGEMFNDEAINTIKRNDIEGYRFYPDVYAAAGNGYINVDERYEVFSLNDRLFDIIGSPEYIDMIRVYGDSMEPKYKSGDWLFVDKRFKKFTKEGIYVILSEGVLMVKYLLKIPKGIKVHSLNKEYPDIDYLFEEMSDNDLIIIGIVKGAVTFN